jgi:hypothetical protein
MGYNLKLCDLKSLLVIKIPKHNVFMFAGSFVFCNFILLMVFVTFMFWAWILGCCR